MAADTCAHERPESSPRTERTEPTEAHPSSQGSVTYRQAEAMAEVTYHTRSAAAVAQVLTDKGLSLR